ncbi:hypothetical protein [Agrococcus jenensis]|uniref:Uncharacterized protein n=1 Tax=Agrococcus jenensis TaxID=46353 RepID=A0A3N2AQL4_9MICO|nr:hypothetical protein [Agrococcus jenensis]ROR65002.1 hypothetical protein EDD26_0356 [Agrococcus jenensis]
MRNPFSAIVNWVAALLASGSGAPHPIVSTDRARKPQTSRKRQPSRKPKPKPKPKPSRKPKRRRR